MRQFYIFAAVVLFAGGVFSVNAQDLIVLRDGNVIEAKVVEVSPSEIRYRRFDNLDGPVCVIPAVGVLSIRYENGVLDIINASPTVGQERGQTNAAASYDGYQLGTPTPLQIILNTLPAIPIAGNNLKFQFGGDRWVATVNRENFSAGTIELEDTNDGYILTLKQTHIWPGAVGRTAGRVANMIPGGSAVGGILDTAGRVAGAVGAIEASGPEIVLEYKAGPPARLSFIRSSTTAGAPYDEQMTGAHPLTAENRFDLNGFNVFAISFTGIPTIWWAYGAGGTITIFEQYKPNAFFSPSYFLSGKWIGLNIGDDIGYGYVGFFTLGAGVLFKHRFPRNRVLWNLGASLEFMSVWGGISNVSFDYTYQDYDYNGSSYTSTGHGYASYSGDSFLLGIGIQTGFSFRFNPYTSLDINGLLKFPFGTVNMKQDYELIRE